MGHLGPPPGRTVLPYKWLRMVHAAAPADPDTEVMRIHVTGPRIIDLDRGTVSDAPPADCCDLCRAKAQLYRLLQSVDALCETCFGMWHG